jgi:hypothetical protein
MCPNLLAQQPVRAAQIACRGSRACPVSRRLDRLDGVAMDDQRIPVVRAGDQVPVQQGRQLDRVGVPPGGRRVGGGGQQPGPFAVQPPQRGFSVRERRFERPCERHVVLLLGEGESHGLRSKWTLGNTAELTRAALVTPQL